MSDASTDLGVLSDDVKSSWHRFLDVFEPMRPELHRYCRYLTRSPWDAEDLVQDALMRAFVTLGTVFKELPNPRAWLFRVASNLWIDRVRRSRFELAIEVPGQAEALDARGPREAAGSLLVRLSPQERAAVVLKDVFDFSLEEIADVLSTTPGAIKAALHRGRGKLLAPEDPPSRVPAPGVLDAFCDAFNARDLERLTSLLLDGATVEIVGVVTEYGPDAPKDPHTGSFAGTMSPITLDERGGVPLELLEGYLGTIPRCEARQYRDTWLLLFWFEHDTGPAVRTLMTVETEGDHVALVRNYFFSPDVIAEVCTELGVPYRVNGYRYWHGAEPRVEDLGRQHPPGR
jgi:RNA polymerase sigma-70 factor, ECF subfamily